MPQRVSKTGSELFIVVNSDEDWKGLRYLHDWCQISRAIDIATAYFEIGAILGLDGEWQKVDTIRILMGDEVSRRTKAAITEAIRLKLEESLEREKEKNDFLVGVPAIVEGLRSGKITCKVYRKKKFHAKTYITHARQEVVGSFGLVGSSNFTFPGLTENVELNVRISGPEVGVLQEWYEEHWQAAEDVTAEILHVIQRHTREYSPFEVYAKAMHELHRRQEMTDQEWLERQSRVYPILDQYQKDGFHQLLRIANNYSGAFLCDGVGLGKTFVGLMLIEYLVAKKRKRVALFVPKAANEAVWEAAINQYLAHLKPKAFGGDLTVFNHSDLQRKANQDRDYPELMADIKERADVVLIDEAHHFRNPGVQGTGGVKGRFAPSERTRPSRYTHMYNLIEGPEAVKQVFLLTATPINNELIDLQHMIELFSRRQPDYFKRVGVHSLPGHFRSMEKALERTMAAKDGEVPTQTNMFEAEEVLFGDVIFRELVVQRSRAYVVQSQLQQGGAGAMFPTRDDPKIAPYSVKKTYGKLLNIVDAAFSKTKPLFSLAIYYPLAYYQGDNQQINSVEENRQKQVVGLIRTQFLKRFESSAHAFECSCFRLLRRFLAFVMKNSKTMGEQGRLQRWQNQHAELIGYVQVRQRELFGEDENEEEADEDIIDEELLESVEMLSRDDYDVGAMLSETFLDLDQVAEFLDELRKFKAKHDDKLTALVKLLKTDPVLKRHKVLIFSEFSDTARYLKQQLVEHGVAGVEQVASDTKRDRADIIRCFAPYYNGTTSAEIAERNKGEIRVLISTDVLAEGLNLQDATRLINYDLHWNPVRLMQRIGRVDRRMNRDTEARLLADHPDQKDIRGKVAYWNFLPPDELDGLLRLYGRVSHKMLRISKTFGIEGQKLLRPDDDFEALKNFNHRYEGEATQAEKIQLEYQQLLRDHPDLAERLNALPGRIFSGKRHPTEGARAVFFCYSLPAIDRSATAPESGHQLGLFTPTEAPAKQQVLQWTPEAGRTAWYLFDLATEKILDDPTAIIDAIRCQPDTPRVCTMEQRALAEIRGKVEKHIDRTYLKSLQAPQGVKPALKAWMELS